MTHYETELGVHDGITREFHSSLYYPKGLALHYPGYILGIEKAAQATVHGPGPRNKSNQFMAVKPEYFNPETKSVKWQLGSQNLLDKLTDDPKTMFVSHVTKYSFRAEEHIDSNGAPPVRYISIDSCLLYNAYKSPYFVRTSTRDMNPREWNDLNGVLLWDECSGAPQWSGANATLDPREFYDNGLPAIRALASSAAKDIAANSYTHILVQVMGWNTAQDEAIRNYNDITGNLIAAARESNDARKLRHLGPINFRPLVIGVSWPSYWNRGLTNVFSFRDKAFDADELGISWLNLLINRELPAALKKVSKEHIPVVLIGHSFGVRVITRVAASAPALVAQDGEPHEGLYTGAKLVIGLQGAASINRFWSGEGESPGDEGSPLREYAKLSGTRFAFTAARNDSAAGGPIFWSAPSGSMNSFAVACGKPGIWKPDTFRCLRASDNSGLKQAVGEYRWEGFKVCDVSNINKCTGMGETLDMSDSRILYVDASEGITEFNTLGTGGNAHSDIFRLPMGRLLWTLVSSIPLATQ